MKQNEVKIKNGETIKYYDIGSKNNEVLLLIHGNVSSAIFFEPVFQELSQKYRIIAPDLRGFGNSSYNNKINDLKDFADDIKELVDFLKIKKFKLLGWSLGGNISMEFSANYPEMVEKLILLSSGSPKGYPVYKKDALGAPLINEIYAKKEDLALDPIQVLPMLNIFETNNVAMLEFIYGATIFTKNKPDSNVASIWMKNAIKQKNLVDVDWALANFNITNEKGVYQDGNGKINNIKCDVLILWGNKDITVPFNMFEETTQAFKNAKVRVFEGCGHALIVDERDKFISEVLEFLS